ncbi:PRTRC system protein E [Burkholderia sp. MSMB1498]|uniref:PRTRC system protein E n=1 Tax=Burkholderia sp. MSMB1498 TaxID=1637842 RepID=UPI00075BA061|nr:PRTRC system protein E [Burkholderia sp. MSMB1498]KVK89452.1 hypothetical protein WS91_28705 [Burkholderia sp. MSMB1498]
MFHELEPLIRSAEKLSLSLTTDGDLIVVFVAPQGGNDAALRQPLILKGTAAELEEGFATAIGGFTAARKSLEEQVAATIAILESQQQSQATKAQKALAKASKPAASSTEADLDTDDMEAGTAAVSSNPMPAVDEEPAGTDLSSLLL